MKSKRTAAKKSKPSGSYAARLLFQFRVMVDGSPGARRTCEERSITFSVHRRSSSELIFEQPAESIRRES